MGRMKRSLNNWNTKLNWLAPKHVPNQKLWSKAQSSQKSRSNNLWIFQEKKQKKKRKTAMTPNQATTKPKVNNWKENVKPIADSPGEYISRQPRDTWTDDSSDIGMFQWR